jgi:hypothetical protein
VPVRPRLVDKLLGDVVGNIGRLERGPAQFTEDAVRAEAALRELAEREFEHGVPSHGEPFAAASRSIGELLQTPA